MNSPRLKTLRHYFRPVYAALGVVCILISVACLNSSLAAEKWVGVDEAVVEKVAKEHGREAREPLINTDKGDLLLFVFLIAGTVGGFAAGYYWRALTERRSRNMGINQERGINK